MSVVFTGNLILLGGLCLKGGGEGSPNLPYMVFYDSVRYPKVPLDNLGFPVKNPESSTT